MVTELDIKNIKELFDKSNVIKLWKEELNANMWTVDIYESTPLHILEHDDKYIHVIFEEVITSYTINKPSIGIRMYDGIEFKSLDKKSKILDCVSDIKPDEIIKRVSYALFDRNNKSFIKPNNDGYYSELCGTETYIV